ncbi:hypothetical protein [Haladaptatus pallidirubidus]|uniref:Uncharacterized protein n=1 Tax=Haladaptatus pallidirubidus TaxID=1008152 RepID=A0AAV3UJ47_9EURY|nr:hypothetical protein [Haladaptatus pallidirubidus]
MTLFKATKSYSKPPAWATKQRRLFDLTLDAVDSFVEHYFTDDGSPLWPPDGHVGIDGSDDLIEGFYNWPLVYAMGGDRLLLDAAKKKYLAVIDRLSTVETPYGHPMYVDEFDQGRDWFHLGEGNLYTYNIGLADPADDAVVERAERFASMYFGDSKTGNYDAEKRIVRSPQTGSMGPDYGDFSKYVTHGYGSDYRWWRHGLPWRDVPEFNEPADLHDPENEELLFEVLNERCTKGDIPLNLNITSLMTNAYLHTSDDRYREWVFDYLEGWRERTSENGGIIPDNVGRSGEIGEYTNGKWYGGYYGWSWGGWHYVGIGPTVAAENAVLLDGDREHLAFPRSQLDLLIERGIEVSADAVNDTLYLPHKYGDPGNYHYNASGVLRENDGEVRYEDGWFEFQPHKDDPYAVHLWYMSMSDEDRKRVRDLRNYHKQDWRRVDPRAKTKHADGHEYAWLAYLDGGFQDYPERIMEASQSQVRERMRFMRQEGYEPDEIDEDYLRNRNPVSEKGLLQLTMGAPQPIYYGGLVMAQVRHFDCEREQPGLPDGVAALIDSITSEGIGLTLVNTSGQDREMLVQAGAYGEHEFTTVKTGDEEVRLESNVITVLLPSGTRLSLSAEMNRFSNDPSYEIPSELDR